MTRLNYKYSIDTETKVVGMILDEIDWFQENKYPVVLPQSLKIGKQTKFEQSEIRQAVKDEFDSSQYLSVQKKIDKDWRKYENNFSDNLQSLHLSAQGDYNVVLTKYGPNGMYTPPRKVILNIDSKKPVGVIIHEIVHISIEKLIQKYNIHFLVKERLVDQIVESMYPGLMGFQKSPSLAEKVDTIFKNHYPNVPKAIKELTISK